MPVAASVRRLAASVSVAVVAAAGLLAAAPAADAANPDLEQQFVAAVNAARAGSGLAPYAVTGDLTAVARGQSDRMAARDALFHNPSLATDVTGWQMVGENVGTGPTVTDIANAFMASPEHRANILDPGFTQVGIGVTVDGTGRIWVTEDFRQPMNVAAPRPAAPAAPAAPAVPAAPVAPAAPPAAAAGPAAPAVPSSGATGAQPSAGRSAAGGATGQPGTAANPSTGAARADAAALARRLDEARARPRPGDGDPVAQAVAFTSVMATLTH